MDPMTAILITLITYKVVLLGIGLVAQRMTRNQADLYLGGRRMGPLVAAISASASSSSVWTLLGVSGMAYRQGLAALWLFPACVGGFALNWCLLAPRLRRHSRAVDALTLTDVLAGPPGAPGRRRVVVLASVITLLCLLIYVAAQLNGASKSFASAFHMQPVPAILLGSAIIVAYMLLGGFWAVSLTDTLQGLVMAAVAVLLPVTALVAVGGYGPLFERLVSLGLEGGKYMSPTRDLPLVLGIGMVLGLLGIGLGYPGQPHVVNRFMALRDEAALRRARIYALAWAVLVYAGMITLGLCGRLLLEAIPADDEQMFFALAKELFHPVVTGVVLAAVLSAIMSTADSQLLVAASTVSHDLRLARSSSGRQIGRDRLVILGLSALAVLAAIYGEKKIFDQVLSAWTSLGAAFGPLLIWILWRGPVSTTVALTTMATGFLCSLVTHLAKVFDLWNLHGFDRNFFPYVAAFAVLLLVGRAPRRRPAEVAAVSEATH